MRRALFLLAGLATSVPAWADAQHLMTWPDLLSRALPHADARIPYGPGPLQFADLYVPPGTGPFRTVVMVHGGCWQTDVAKVTIMNYAADDLRRHGLAVWNIEYRGVDRDGGGFPGTFRDVATAADALRAVAPRYHLRLDRLTALGHSAGGHLALWLAARHRLRAGDPLYTADPLPIGEVISLGGLPDLRLETTPPFDHGCDADPVWRMAGAASPGRPDVFADTSPVSLLPLGVPQTLINGGDDRIAPPALAASYVAKADAAGDRAALVVVPAQGHVEEISPGTPAWRAVLRALGN